MYKPSGLEGFFIIELGEELSYFLETGFISDQYSKSGLGYFLSSEKLFNDKRSRIQYVRAVTDAKYKHDPEWAEKFDLLINEFIENNHIDLNKSNFSDLSVNSIFTKKKPFLHSLIDEINQDVFENNGIIKENVPLMLIGYQNFFDLDKNTTDPQNLIIYYPPKQSFYSGHGRSYIGVMEHGKYEIRVIAQGEKFNFWDIEIDWIIDGLRTAIKWWQNESKYSKEELEEMSRRSDYEEEYNQGKAYWDDMADYGISPDDD